MLELVYSTVMNSRKLFPQISNNCNYTIFVNKADK